MGNKRDKMTQASVLSAEEIITAIEPIGGITFKKMFGGHGIFHDEKMFCIVDSKGVAFLKADDTTIEDYHQLSSQQHSRMPYYTIPDEVLLDADKLREWTKKSIGTIKK